MRVLKRMVVMKKKVFSGKDANFDRRSSRYRLDN